MNYADFVYYRSDFGGKTISSETDFDSVIGKASAYIDRITFGRAKEKSDSEDVKKAACAVAEVMYRNESRYGISSENNDGYSVTYLNNSTKELRDQKRAAYLFLSDDLIYRGVL